MTLPGFIHAAVIFLVMVYAVNFPLIPLIRAPWARLAVAPALALVLVFLPIPWIDTVYLFLAGFFWPVSAALAIGLPYRLLVGAGGPFKTGERDYLIMGACVILCGVLVIPGALFPVLPGLYGLGYSGPVVPALMASMLLWALVLRSWLVTAWIALASVWSLAGINPGTNLWDSLIDPLAFVGAVVIVISIGLRRLRARP